MIASDAHRNKEAVLLSIIVWSRKAEPEERTPNVSGLCCTYRGNSEMYACRVTTKHMISTFNSERLFCKCQSMARCACTSISTSEGPRSTLVYTQYTGTVLRNGTPDSKLCGHYNQQCRCCLAVCPAVLIQGVREPSVPTAR